MKYFRFVIVAILLLFTSSPSIATDEDALRQKVASNFEKLIAKSKIQEPTPETITRAPGGVKRYRDASNGIVLIFTPKEEEDMISGSGVVLSYKGLVVTNWHVVENEPVVVIIFKKVVDETIRDKTSLRKEDIFTAEVLKTDPVRDLALLQIVSPPPNLTVLRLGSMSQVEVGQDVFAIGHPEGLLWSYTEGVVSQIRPNYQPDGTTFKATYIQTQAVIGHGSSGGGLFDYNGQLIGIVALSRAPGLNLAIAVNEVQGFVMPALEKR